MKKTVIILMLLTIVSKILGFSRDITLSYFFGATEISDIYLISLTIPTVILAIIGKGISTGFIPMYTRIKSADGLEKAKQYTDNVANIVILLCTIILLFGLVFTEPIVKLFASGFDGETLKITVTFTRITLFGVYFTGLGFIFTAFLNIKGKFIVPVLMGIPSNIIVIGSFFLSSKTNIYILATGSLLAVFSQFLLLIIYVYKNNYRFKFRLDFNDLYVRRMLIIALPVIIGTAVSRINLLIDRTLASSIAVGGISALNYANTINLMVLGIFVAPIISVLFPKLSKNAAENNMNEMKKSLSNAITTINIFVLPITIAFMIFAEPIVQLLYGRGSFDMQAILLTSTALFFYSLGIIFDCHKDIYSNVFYSFQDTKTPMVNATIAMVINIILNIILSKYLGIGGLALATSISTIICSFLLIFSLRKRIGNFGFKNILTTFIKIFVASLAIGGVSKLTYELLIGKLGLNISLLIAVAFGMFAYFVIIYFMKIKEVNIIVVQMKNKLTKLSRPEKDS